MINTAAKSKKCKIVSYIIATCSISYINLKKNSCKLLAWNVVHRQMIHVCLYEFQSLVLDVLDGLAIQLLA